MMIKDGVHIAGVRPEIVLALVIAQGVYDAHDQPLLVTSVVDGEHMRASLHYVGAAVDLGNPTMGMASLLKELRVALGTDYDVVPESRHIHIEFQPKIGI